jgi:hypothetical protein
MGKSHGKPFRTLESHDSVIKLPDYGCIAREIPGLIRREGKKKRRKESSSAKIEKKRATKKEAKFRIFFPLKVQRILHNPLRSQQLENREPFIVGETSWYSLGTD